MEGENGIDFDKRNVEKIILFLGRSVVFMKLNAPVN